MKRKFVVGVLLATMIISIVGCKKESSDVSIENEASVVATEESTDDEVEKEITVEELNAALKEQIDSSECVGIYELESLNSPYETASEIYYEDDSVCYEFDRNCMKKDFHFYRIVDIPNNALYISVGGHDDQFEKSDINHSRGGRFMLYKIPDDATVTKEEYDGNTYIKAEDAEGDSWWFDEDLIIKFMRESDDPDVMVVELNVVHEEFHVTDEMLNSVTVYER